MGEVSDMILDGTMCSGCGDMLGKPTGFPGMCSSCSKEENMSVHAKAWCRIADIVSDVRIEEYETDPEVIQAIYEVIDTFSTRAAALDEPVVETSSTGRERVMCPYCGQEAKAVTGKDVYPRTRNTDLKEKMFFMCKPCKAWVGCHSTGQPLGALANAELRRARQGAHKAFDPLWEEQHMARNEAYTWLRGTLGLPKDKCHMGAFNLETCNDVIRECDEKMVEFRNKSRANGRRLIAQALLGDDQDVGLRPPD